MRLITIIKDSVDGLKLVSLFTNRRRSAKVSDEQKMNKTLHPKQKRLKDLQTSQTRLLNQKNGKETYLKELNYTKDKKIQKL